MFDIINKTKGKPPHLPFCEIKNFILGEKYELSLVFIGDRRSAKLNKKYRKIDKSTNILTFPLDKNAGEIFINFTRSKKESSRFDRTTKSFIGFLFIHGLLHLKGYLHGSTMEKKEDEICRKFNI